MFRPRFAGIPALARASRTGTRDANLRGGDSLEVSVDRMPFGNLEVQKGICMASIFTLQRSAIATVRSSASGISPNTCAISSAVLKKNWSVANFMRCVSLMVLPVWMQSNTSCACASECFRIVAIVCRDERNAGFARERHNLRVDALLDVQALVLNFQKEVSLPENVAQAVGGLAGLIRLFFHQTFSHGAAQTRRQRDQAVAVFRQQVVIDSGLVVKTLEVAGGDELDQIPVAFRIFAQQYEVIVAALPRFRCRSMAWPLPVSRCGVSPRSCRLPLATYTSQPMIGLTPRVLAAW